MTTKKTKKTKKTRNLDVKTASRVRGGAKSGVRAGAAARNNNEDKVAS